MDKKDIHKEVTMKILLLLDKVASGDIETWIPVSGMAENPQSKHVYTSINQLLLSCSMYMHNYSHNRWLTFNQVKEAGGSVRKGEKSTPVLFFETIYRVGEQKLTSIEAKIHFQEAKRKDPRIVTYLDAGILTKPFSKYYWVFNIAQAEGLPESFFELPEKANNEFRQLDTMLTLQRMHDIKIVHMAGGSAEYDSLLDKILMPFPEQFPTNELYYATLLHEMVHWSGHESRLNRTIHNSFGTEEYAYEELVAELGSAFLCARLNIPASLTSTSAYIKSWLKALKDDRNYILKAVRHAEKAADYVMSKEKELELSHGGR